MIWQRQRGYSLISIMVGMIVAMLATISIMSLYRVVIHNLFDSNSGIQQRSAQDRQLATGLLTIQNLVQGAGFGVASPSTNKQFILLTGTTLNTISGNSQLTAAGTLQAIASSSVSGNAIFWEINKTLDTNSSNWVCQGLLSDQTTKAVYFLTSTTSCHPVYTQWSSQTWSVTRIISPNTLADALTFTSFLDTTKCSPFGAEIASTSLSTAISDDAGINTPSAGSAGLKLQFNWSTLAGSTPWLSCLINFTS